MHREEILVFQAEGSFWCDPMSVAAGDPPDATHYAELHKFDLHAKGKPFEACGHTLYINVGERVAWADEVAALDVKEPIWKIGVDDFWNFRDVPADDSSYWVGLGPCAVCDTGLVAAVEGSDEGHLVFQCSACDRVWPTPFHASCGDSGQRALAPVGLRFASAGQVARDRKRRFALLINAQERDERSLDHHSGELWTLRPRTAL